LPCCVPQSSPVARSHGAWPLTLTGNSVAGGSAPFSIICAENGGELAFTTNSAPNITQILTDTRRTRPQIPEFGALTDIATPPIAPRATRWWRKAGLRRAMGPIPS